MSNSVGVNESTMLVHHPLTREPLGEIVSRVYENEGVMRHSFFTSKKTYSLGPTTDSFRFVDWPEVFQPLMEQGYEISKLIIARGGLKVAATLHNPKGPTYKDPINWDSGTWGEGLKNEGLKDGVTFTGGLRPGFGYHFHRGFFRLVCTNGLRLETLGLGDSNMSHTNFSSEKLIEELFGYQVVTTPSGDFLLGEPIGKMSAIKKVQKVLTGLNKTVYEEGEEQPIYPPFVKELLAPLEDLSKPLRSKVVEQFEAMVQNSGRKEVYELDLANALTTATNLLQKVPSRSFFGQKNAQQSLVKLTGIYSL